MPRSLLLSALLAVACDARVPAEVVDSGGNSTVPKAIEAVASSFVPGTSKVLEAPSPSGVFSAVFEDDGEAGYFYALDMSRAENPIVDAVHIYNVAGVSDRDKVSRYSVAWSPDGKKVVLLINAFPHAVFDFEAKRGYCRTGFPPADKRWSSFSHDWSDDALELFR